MSLKSLLFRGRQQSFVFEVTQRCNHDCLHCYNAWKNPRPYPTIGELPTGETLDILGRMLGQTQATLVTLTGGEPMLRADIFDIVDFLHARKRTINLISNGSLLDDAAIARFGPDKISIFELPLLSVERAIHDRLSGVPGAFDKVTMAVASLKAARQRVVAVFVATRLNLPTYHYPLESLHGVKILHAAEKPGGGGRIQLNPAVLDSIGFCGNPGRETKRYGVFRFSSLPPPPDFSAFGCGSAAPGRETAELAIALGADGIMFNRFNPGGTGARSVEMLQASPAELSAALEIANELSDRYKISMSCSIPMPPCLFETARYPKLSFGFRAAGTSRAYYTLDPLGNVRPCNHSPTILGNIRQTTFAVMVKSETMTAFMAARPAFCSRCRLESTCLGGCKASAEACLADISACDPFLAAYAENAKKIE